jgi:hypothetical protein
MQPRNFSVVTDLWHRSMPRPNQTDCLNLHLSSIHASTFSKICKYLDTPHQMATPALARALGLLINGEILLPKIELPTFEKTDRLTPSRRKTRCGVHKLPDIDSATSCYNSDARFRFAHCRQDAPVARSARLETCFAPCRTSCESGGTHGRRGGSTSNPMYCDPRAMIELANTYPSDST